MSTKKTDAPTVEFSPEEAEKLMKENETPEQAEKRKAEEQQVQKIRQEQEKKVKAYITQRKNFLKDQLPLLRLEHEHVKLQVEYYEYEEKLRMIQEARQRAYEEEMAKEEAAKKAKQTANKKVVTPDRSLVGMDGAPIKKE